MINIGKLDKLEQRVSALLNPINPNLPTKEELRDFLTFTKYFYKLATGRDFGVSQPICRRSHQLVLADLVPSIISQEKNRLIINLPPRYGKTVWAIHLIAYGLAFYPDSQYLYISYSAEVAIKQTATIRSILMLPEFREIFGVELSTVFNSKHDFMTTAGGRVLGVGAGGGITSNGAGIKYCKRFGGLAVIDDIHKPDETHSKGIRDNLKVWFKETFKSRINTPETPIICIGQILHEDDIPMNLRRSGLEDSTVEKKTDLLDTEKWDSIILRGLDEAGNALDPAMHSAEEHRRMEAVMPYMWWAQYQQEPQPSGGGIFKLDNFTILEDRPDNIVETFITVDTAETSKTYNDATVFSFWGLYRLKINGIEANLWGLHWLDCREIRVDPKDLKDNFMQFYYDCCRFKIPPVIVGIEKKSTGTTLISVLSELPSIRVVNTIDHRIELKKIDEIKEKIILKSNKIDRFLSHQEFVFSRRITFDKYMKHAKMCIDHLVKITANDTHSHDDIADTMSDAILMIPFMERQVRKPVGGTIHIPGYKAIPDYRKNSRKRWP